MTQEDMPLEKALETIKQIAERFERISECEKMARRVDRKRADTIHDQAPAGSDSGGNDSL